MGVHDGCRVLLRCGGAVAEAGRRARVWERRGGDPPV